jgi:hypothetical protein
MEQAAFDKQLLVATILFLGWGGVLLTALTNHGRRRFRFTALIGGIAGVLAYGASRDPVTGVGETFRFVLSLSLYAAIGAIVAALLTAGVIGLRKITPQRFRPFKNGTESILAPAQWRVMENDDKPPQLTTIDIARRWFVTIAAGTGAAVGSIVGTSAFWQALEKSVTPGGLLAAALLAIVSVVLIGPFQDYVLEKRDKTLEEGAMAENQLSDLFTGATQIRAWLRLGLIGLLLLGLELVFNSMDNSIKAGDSFLLLLILTGGVPAAIVSFYWSAALQQDVLPLAKRTTGASTLAAIVLYSGIAITFFVAIAAPPLLQLDPYFIAYAVGALLMGVVMVLALVLFTTTFYAFFGAWVLDRHRGLRGVAYLTLALFAAAGVQAIFSFFLTSNIENAEGGIWATINMFGIAGGWALGLFVSGFPRLVTKSPTPHFYGVQAERAARTAHAKDRAARAAAEKAKAAAKMADEHKLAQPPDGDV